MGEPERTIGDYRLLGVLGRGGMGVVYRAEHLRTGQAAALKTVLLPRAGLLQNLRREIRALARLRHPGIVRILDEGVEDGLPWYAMELLEGATLRRVGDELARRHARPEPAGPQAVAPTLIGASREPAWWTSALDAGTVGGPEEAGPVTGQKASAGRALPLPAAAGSELRAALSLVRRLCSPLGFLHGEGIVHRDLKPENVFIRAASGEQRAASGDKSSPSLAARGSQLAAAGRPVLVDFGLVSRFGGEAGREALEVAGAAVGTVAYMAPEQIRGELVDARADLYALGCILYELVTGRPPFAGRERGELLRQHLEAEPVGPSRLAEGVPQELEALILRLLAKRPQERLGHADDLATALAELGAEDGLADAGPPTRAYLYRPGFVGREDVLLELEERLERAAAGRGGLALVGGESGAGKTRLAMELARRARRRGTLVLAGECVPGAGEEGGGALGALRRPLQAIADRCREGGVEETRRVFGHRGKVLGLYEPVLEALPGQEACPAPAELPAEAARMRVLHYLAETFEALTGERHAASGARRAGGPDPRSPLLLLLDDLQWSDELTLAFLEFLLRSGRLERMRLLVVGTFRTDEVGAALGKLLEDAEGHVLRLGRLGEAEVASIAGGMLALSPPPEAFARFLLRHSEGNPFFVAEYLRTAVSEGLLYRDLLGRWCARVEGATVEAAYEALPLPRSLHEVVARRLEGLGGGALRLAEAAAVLGRESEARLLAAVSGAEPESFDEAVEELLRRQVLEEPDAERLRFVHDKIREGAYGRIGPERRRELHRAAAEALETGAEAGQPEHLAALGQHWERAGEDSRARRCYLAGARQAQKRHASGEAERLYQAYLQLVTEPMHESVAARQELARESLLLQCRVPEAFAEMERSVAEARTLGDRRAELHGLVQLGWLHRESGRPEEARALSLELLGPCREAGLSAKEGHVRQTLGVVAAHLGRFEEAGSHYEEALRLERETGNRKGEVMSLTGLAALRAMQGASEAARELYEQAVEVARSVDDRHGEGNALNALGVLHAIEGRTEEALASYEQALGLCRETGARRDEAVALGNLAALQAERGRLEEADALYDKAIALHRENGNRRSSAITLGDRAVLERRRGRLEGASRLLDTAVAELQRLKDTFYLSRYLCERGHLELASGRPAGRWLDEARSGAVRLSVRPGSDLGQSVARLQRAQEAFEAGRPLFQGECAEDLPEGLRQRLIGAGEGTPSQTIPK